MSLPRARICDSKSHSSFTYLAAAVALIAAGASVSAQTFDLVVPDTGAHSVARMQNGQLHVVDESGHTTVYDRDRQYDNATFLGFTSRRPRQSMRFPRSGSGSMQIGRLGPRGIEFRPSQMNVAQRAAPTVTLPVTPAWQPPRETIPVIDPNTVYTIQSALSPALALAAPARDGGNVFLAARGTAGTAFRLLQTASGYVYIVSADNPNFAIGMQEALFGQLANAAMFDRAALPQLELLQYKIVQGPDGYVSFMCRGADDYALGVDQENASPLANVSLSVFHGSRGQRFILVPNHAPVQPPISTPKLISSRTVNEQAGETTVELANTHKHELWVLVTNTQDPSDVQRIKIPAGQSKTARFRQDPGEKVVRVYEVIQPDGTIEHKQETVVVRQPESRYDISVYELAPLSIYIDVVKPGSAPVIQGAPKSVGALVVPAKLRGGRSDIYQAALKNQNPGGVRRIDLVKWGLPGQTRYKNAFDRLTNGWKPKYLGLFDK